jgi:Icc-related predicted phosphoesterase
MKIQYCSDLHLEFPENKFFLERHPIKVQGEVLLLAGDILPFSLHEKQPAFIGYVADNFEAVYWIPGNHEYYSYDLGNMADPLLEKIRSNVWLVNNRAVPYKEVNFICSTLWSKINVLNALDIQRNVSDFFAIRWQGKKFTTRQFNELHRDAFSFLQKAIAENVGAKNIVVTHHVPTLMHYPPQYRNSPINEAFAVELFDFIESTNAAYRVYGHHHCNTAPFKINNTTMLTNQLGYVKQNEHQLFNPAAIIEI